MRCQFRHLPSAERPVPNRHIIDARRRKTCPVGRPRADRKRRRRIVIHPTANCRSFRDAIHVQCAAAIRERHHDMVPICTRDRAARDQHRRRPPGLTPNNPRGERIGIVQGQDTVGELPVRLPGQHRSETAATIWVLRRAGPLDPHADGPLRRGIQTASSRHAHPLRGSSVECQRPIGHAVSVGTRGHTVHQRAAGAARRRGVTVKRPIRKKNRRIAPGPRTMIEPRFAPGSAKVRPARLVTPKRIQRDQRSPIRVIGRREIANARRSVHEHARGPILRRPARQIRIALGERCARTIRCHRPFAPIAIFDLVHQSIVAIAQLELPAAIVQPAGKRTHDIPDALGRLQCRRVRCNHQISAARNDRSFRKCEIHRSFQRPLGQIDVDRHLVVQFHPFVQRLVAHGMIMNFIEHHHAVYRESWTKRDRQKEQQ